MQAPSVMMLAFSAVMQIDEQSLLAITQKLIDDIREGKYPDGHRLTSRVCVGDLREQLGWWWDPYTIALLVACASGNLVRLACHAVGVNPCDGDFRQLLTLCTAPSAIEFRVLQRLVADAPQIFRA